MEEKNVKVKMQKARNKDKKETNDITTNMSYVHRLFNN